MNLKNMLITVFLLASLNIYGNVQIRGKLVDAKQGRVSVFQFSPFLTEYTKTIFYNSYQGVKEFDIQLKIDVPQFFRFSYSGLGSEQTILFSPNDKITFNINQDGIVFYWGFQG